MDGVLMPLMLYTDPALEFGKERRHAYRAPVSTKIIVLITFVTCAVILLCASDSSSSSSSLRSDSTDSSSSLRSDSVDSVGTVVSFTELFTRAVELASCVAHERSKAAARAGNTFEMPAVTSPGETEARFEHNALTGNHTDEAARLRVEYRVMCCLVEVYATMIDPGHERLREYAGLFGLLASDVCRSLLTNTHKDEETDTNVVAMHWYFRGRHDIYGAPGRHIRTMAVDGSSDESKRGLESLLSNAKSTLDAAFSLVA